jgi:hypothetical protein
MILAEFFSVVAGRFHGNAAPSVVSFMLRQKETIG